MAFNEDFHLYFGGQRWSFTSRIILWQHRGQCPKNQEAKDASSVLFPLITSDDSIAAARQRWSLRPGTDASRLTSARNGRRENGDKRKEPDKEWRTMREAFAVILPLLPRGPRDAALKPNWDKKKKKRISGF